MTESLKALWEDCVHRIISMMNGHENMHIDQIIAFCYATGIEIPQSISEPMALEG